MADIKNILFATDYSEGSARACDLVRTLTRLTGARLTVLHVVTELVDRQRKMLPPGIMKTVAEEVERHAVEDMHKFCDAQFSGLEVGTEIVIGRADEEILKLAESLAADLIVLGTHGRTGIEKLLVGSTAEKVVRSSRIPVLTVRE